MALNTAVDPATPPVVQTQPGVPPAAAEVFLRQPPCDHVPLLGIADPVSRNPELLAPMTMPAAKLTEYGCWWPLALRLIDRVAPSVPRRSKVSVLVRWK